MAKEKITAPAFDDIVFENRNKEYGAYTLRKKYSRNVIIAMAIGIVVISTAIIAPYLNAKAAENRTKREERQVEIKMENLDQPAETVAPPPRRHLLLLMWFSRQGTCLLLLLTLSNQRKMYSL